jgi:hypothetical protein
MFFFHKSQDTLTHKKEAIMPTYMKSIISILLTISSLNCYSAVGGESSGGGGGFYCPHNDTAEVLDIWEGREVFGYTIPNSNEDIDVQINKAAINLNRLAPHISEEVRQLALTLKNEARALPAGVKLAFPHDALPNFEKPDCQLKGLMFFDGDQDIVLYDPLLKSKLVSKTDEAALWMHEALYKVLRDKFGEATSVATRKAVACAFSSKGCIDKLMTLEQLLPKNQKVYKCSNKDVTYFFFQSKRDQSKISLLLSRFMGKELKYPAYNLNTSYSMPEKPTNVRPLYLYINALDKIGGDLNFPIFEKSKFKIYIEGVHYSGWGGIFPRAWVGSNLVDEVFKFNDSLNSCVEY